MYKSALLTPSPKCHQPASARGGTTSHMHPDRRTEPWQVIKFGMVLGPTERDPKRKNNSEGSGSTHTIDLKSWLFFKQCLQKKFGDTCQTARICWASPPMQSQPPVGQFHLFLSLVVTDNGFGTCCLTIAAFCSTLQWTKDPTFGKGKSSSKLPFQEIC